MAWLILLLISAFALRLALTISHHGFLGVDGGAYFLSVNYVLGNEPTGAGFPRPPLAPGWLLVPFIQFFGLDNGYNIWSSIASLLPLIPIYLLTRRYVGQVPAIAATAVASLDWVHGAMLVTGALPMIGFGLLGCAWYLMLSINDNPRWWKALLLGSIVGLIPWINQTSAGLAIITLPIYALILWRLRPQSGTWVKYIIPAGVLALAIGMGAFPWYTQVLPGSAILHFDGPWIYPAGPGDPAWIQLIIGLPVAIWSIRKADSHGIKSMGWLLVLLVAMIPWLSYDETVINPFYRARYLMALPFYVCTAWLVFSVWLPRVIQWFPRPVVAATAGIVVLAFGIGYVATFYDQTKYSDMATPATLEALSIPPDGSGIATNAFTLSLWVAALKQSPSPFVFTAPPPVAYIESDQHLRCVVNWVEGCDGPASAQELGVDYVLVDLRFPEFEGTRFHPPNYLAPPDQWERTAEAPWLELAYSEGTTRLWQIKSPDLPASAHSP